MMISLLKKPYYYRYEINEENISESYYETQEKIMLERGYGYHKIIEEEKHKLVQEIIKEPKISLDKVIAYFISKNAL